MNAIAWASPHAHVWYAIGRLKLKRTVEKRRIRGGNGPNNVVCVTQAQVMVGFILHDIFQAIHRLPVGLTCLLNS